VTLSTAALASLQLARSAANEQSKGVQSVGHTPLSRNFVRATPGSVEGRSVVLAGSLTSPVLRTWSGEQEFDPNGWVAGGCLAVKSYQAGIAGLSKGCEVVIGPQLVALVVTRGDRTPYRV
jgi:hypothetical protein